METVGGGRRKRRKAANVHSYLGVRCSIIPNKKQIHNTNVVLIIIGCHHVGKLFSLQLKS